MIEAVYDEYKKAGILQKEDGSTPSLAKFVLLSAVRDIERTIQLSMQAESTPPDEAVAGEQPETPTEQ